MKNKEVQGGEDMTDQFCPVLLLFLLAWSTEIIIVNKKNVAVYLRDATFDLERSQEKNIWLSMRVLFHITSPSFPTVLSVYKNNNASDLLDENAWQAKSIILDIRFQIHQ